MCVWQNGGDYVHKLIFTLFANQRKFTVAAVASLMHNRVEFQVNKNVSSQIKLTKQKLMVRDVTVLKICNPSSLNCYRIHSDNKGQFKSKKATFLILSSPVISVCEKNSATNAAVLAL